MQNQEGRHRNSFEKWLLKTKPKLPIKLSQRNVAVGPRGEQNVKFATIETGDSRLRER
jgi:rubrerythrin